jgi:hypothetical protein
MFCRSLRKVAAAEESVLSCRTPVGSPLVTCQDEFYVLTCSGADTYTTGEAPHLTFRPLDVAQDTLRVANDRWQYDSYAANTWTGCEYPNCLSSYVRGQVSMGGNPLEVWCLIYYDAAANVETECDNCIYPHLSNQTPPQPSAKPTPQPSAKPTPHPSAKPTPQPSAKPTPQPSAKPSTSPISQATVQPAVNPSPQPSAKPSTSPISQATVQPAVNPSPQPSAKPSTSPISQATEQPAASPLPQPTIACPPQASVEPTTDSHDSLKSIRHLIGHTAAKRARPKSIHRSGAFVRTAIEIALGIQLPVKHAGDHPGNLGPVLQSVGFRAIDANTDHKNGDVVVWSTVPAHEHGHAQIYYKGRWFSDYAQNNFSPYKNDGDSTAYFYRYFA